MPVNICRIMNKRGHVVANFVERATTREAMFAVPNVVNRDL